MIDTGWARKKLDRARGLLDELKRVSANWLDPVVHPLDVVICDDGWKVEAVLEFRELPPLEQWSLIVGDCAHNIRTALDVFVWANSVLLPETDRGRAAYPILPLVDEDAEDDEELPHRLENQSKRTQEWVRSKVTGLPEPLRSRVVGNMRWASLRHEGDLIWHQRLPLIKELDDIDKHRLALELEASQNTATWDVGAVDAVGARVEVSVDWSPSAGTPAEVGEPMVIATGVPERQIARVSGSASVELGLRVRLFDLSLQVQDFLETSIDDVAGLLDVLSDAE